MTKKTRTYNFDGVLRGHTTTALAQYAKCPAACEVEKITLRYRKGDQVVTFHLNDTPEDGTPEVLSRTFKQEKDGTIYITDLFSTHQEETKYTPDGKERYTGSNTTNTETIGKQAYHEMFDAVEDFIIRCMHAHPKFDRSELSRAIVLKEPTREL